MAAAWYLGRPTLTLSSSESSLAEVHLGGLGATVEQVSARDASGSVPLRQVGSLYNPLSPLSPGDVVNIKATARVPSWLSWLVGDQVSASARVEAPRAVPTSRVVISGSTGHVPVAFDMPVSEVGYQPVGSNAAQLIRLATPDRVVQIPTTGDLAGYLRVSAAAAVWEKLSPEQTRVSWFVAPADGSPAALVVPGPGTHDVASNQPIRLNFDRPVSAVLGSARPAINPAVPGTWSEPDPYSLVFTPSGFGFGPGVHVTVSFPHPVETIGGQPVSGQQAAGTAVSTSSDPVVSSYSFSTGAGSLLRMEQILAQLHYLPLDFTPAAGVSEPSSFAAEVKTMTDPLAGSFSWRWADTPAALEAQWAVGKDNELLKGALMTFMETQPGVPYDGYQATDETIPELATPNVWEALLQAAASNQTDPHPYSYVYVTESLPETLTLWQNGSVILTSPANSGIPQDPTALGTFPIYVRYQVNYMSGTNPDGSHYHDLVHWINYFNGGDAVHAFDRASYGFPQSLGCIELPDAAAQTAFDNLNIGDLVTIAP